METRRRWRLGLAGLLFAAPWIVLAWYSLQAAFPANPLTLPAQHRLLPCARPILPEGWSFFTRDPREADILIFRLSDGGGWQSVRSGPYAQWRHAFGWSRRPRTQGLELGIILATLTRADWHSCRTTEACLAETLHAEAIVVSNPSPVPSLCGKLALIKASPVPWAWARNLGRFHQPEAVAFVVSGC
jgi:antimicrobial peptide system SdpA family protein